MSENCWRGTGLWMLPVLSACGIQVAGGGPPTLGPDGGRRGAGDGDCNTSVDVPKGALDSVYEINIVCEEFQGGIPAGLELNSPMYSFAPFDVSLAIPAVFDLEYERSGEMQVGWSGPGEIRQWTLLSAEVTPETWGDGTQVVSFEHDAFGHFVVLRSVPVDAGAE